MESRTIRLHAAWHLMLAYRQTLALLLLFVPLAGCSLLPSEPAESDPCHGRHRTCAASDAQPGLRKSYRGHRLENLRWLNRPNRESGGADIGLQGESRAIQLQR